MQWSILSCRSCGELVAVVALVLVVFPVQVCGLVHSKKHTETPLTDLIGHYEPLHYDQTEFHARHQTVKRGTSHVLHLDLQAHGRSLSLRLKRDASIFHPEVVIENSNGVVHYDSSSVYTGTIHDDASSTVHGLVTSDGLFEGHIKTSTDSFSIERSSRFFNTTQPFHSVIYKHSDIKPLTNNKQSCQSDTLHRKMRHSGHKKQNHHTARDHTNTRDKYINVSYTNSWQVHNRVRRDSTWSHQSIGVVSHHHEHAARHVQPPPNPDLENTTCTLYMQADHLFYRKFHSNMEMVIEQLTQHVQGVNDIYNQIDFNRDGVKDNIRFIIKRIKVHDDPNDMHYKFKDNYNVENFLEKFSEHNFNNFCLAYMFTYRDFEGGTLGLAWTGDLQNAGGVCEKNGQFRGSMKSLNSGIVTILNYGKDVPSTVSHVTMAHEIGHNMGSQHDPDSADCSPGGAQGNYIMFARATSGDKPNNNRFSNCSKESMRKVMEDKARTNEGCFIRQTTSICGNGVVEDPEQCDCGWKGECKDQCCNPQTGDRGGSGNTPCRLKSNKKCSPSQGPCCTSQCSLVDDITCRDETPCQYRAVCDGSHAECPESVSKPNKTSCDKNSVCYKGECTGSVCVAFGLESCQCDSQVKNDFSDERLCKLCCKRSGEGQPCRPSGEWNLLWYDFPSNLKSKPGSPCNNYKGYCDVSSECKEVEPSGPLANLKMLIFSERGVESLRDWLHSYWYIVVTALVIILLLMIFFIKLCSPRALRKSISSISISSSKQRNQYDKVRGPFGTYTWAFIPNKPKTMPLPVPPPTVGSPCGSSTANTCGLPTGCLSGNRSEAATDTGAVIMSSPSSTANAHAIHQRQSSYEEHPHRSTAYTAAPMGTRLYDNSPPPARASPCATAPPPSAVPPIAPRRPDSPHPLPMCEADVTPASTPTSASPGLAGVGGIIPCDPHSAHLDSSSTSHMISSPTPSSSSPPPPPMIHVPMRYKYNRRAMLGGGGAAGRRAATSNAIAINKPDGWV